MNKSRKNFSAKTSDFLDKKTLESAGAIGIYPETDSKADFPFPISSLEYDSRLVKKGSMYFALPGINTDGHKYINNAIENGAKAIVHQRDLDNYTDGIFYLKVKDSRLAMSPISASFYKHPSKKLITIGVTGTEGKSTTVYLIYQLLKIFGKKAGFISTVQRDYGYGEEWNEEHQTTPEATIIHRLLAEMLDNGLEYAVIESSSHGLSRKTMRLFDVDFDVGVMTNVNHDHLEFHGSWEQYRSDKAELFRALKLFGVLNRDDQSAEYFTEATEKDVYSFSTRGLEADLSVKLFQSGKTGNWYDAYEKSGGNFISIRDKLPGSFNIGNVLAAILVISNLLAIDPEEIAINIPKLKPVRGRMNSIDKGQPFEVYVDYAHTPSSFESVIIPAREKANRNGGKLICLFGSAGERDTEKRPKQGEIASLYSDIIILSDEDPRNENPMSILEDIAKGCETTQGCFATQGCESLIRDENLFLIPDRKRAIRKAISLAGKGDIILLLGKGHENSIIQGNINTPYDEISEAEKALEEAGYSSPSDQ